MLDINQRWRWISKKIDYIVEVVNIDKFNDIIENRAIQIFKGKEIKKQIDKYSMHAFNPGYTEHGVWKMLMGQEKE